MRSSIRSFLFLALLLLVLAVDTRGVNAAKFNRKVDIGQAAPVWNELPATDDKRYRLESFKDAKAVVVIFMCNHCPVAKSYESRILALHNKYRGVGVQVVAISVSRYASDLMPEMKKRASEKQYSFPYLQDESQMVGRDYGAAHTPQIFLLNQQRRIAYMGRIDDSVPIEKVNERYLETAIDAVLKGDEPEITETKPIGCEIHYDDK